jgi:hypothetical protein
VAPTIRLALRKGSTARMRLHRNPAVSHPPFPDHDTRSAD